MTDGKPNHKPLKDHVLLDAPMPIVTEHLTIRPLQEGDGPDLHASKLETWDKLSQVFQWASGTPDADLDEAYARKAHADYILRRDFNLVGIDNATGEPVLYTGIHAHNWGLREFQIGYWVREGAQGKGYAKEAANALVRYAFNQLGANRLVMCHVDGNKASQHIIRSLGFEFEGVRKNSLLFAGNVVRDALWYSRVDAKNLPALKVRW
ncbi:MAG: GNAT family N-acetyltransferase [Rhodospirillales bacterium]|nr:GNAT family N-acetyltransferase [Rhodospirillales bacterium]MCB9995349.1 GNAT family N-acetyltransferase [Rhodospirillales bacterium]